MLSDTSASHVVQSLHMVYKCMEKLHGCASTFSFLQWKKLQTVKCFNKIYKNENKLSNIIIIIIWHYNPVWVFAFWAKSLQVLLSLAVSFQFLTFSSFRSSMTSSCHHCLGLPTGLVPIGFQSNSVLVCLGPFFGYAPAIWFLVSNINITINTTYVRGYLRTLLIVTLHTVLNSNIISE